MKTLAEFFRSEFVPLFLAGKDRRTLAEYRRSVELLDQLCDHPTIQTANLYGSQFTSELAKAGAAPATIAKHCRHLNAIFRKLGPKGHRNHDALGKLKYTPYFPIPKLRKSVPKLFTDDEFQRLYRGFGGETDFPRYLPAKNRGRYWQTIMLFVSVTAVRREVVIGATWNDINQENLFLTVRPENDKKDKVRYKPISATLLRQLQELKALGHPTGPKRNHLFPWVHGRKAWYDTWKKAELAAGVKLGLHDLKRFSGELALRAGATVLELQQHMDHANIRTTMDHYCRPQTRQLVDRIIVPIPDDEYRSPLDEGPPEYRLNIDTEIAEAEQRVDELRLQKLLGGGIDVQKLAAIMRGEAWPTDGGTVLTIFDGERGIG